MKQTRAVRRIARIQQLIQQQTVHHNSQALLQGTALGRTALGFAVALHRRKRLARGGAARFGFDGAMHRRSFALALGGATESQATAGATLFPLKN